MDQLNALERFDLGTQGDRHEREFWPLLSDRFPSYEILWRRLIVPLTNRVDPQIAEKPQEWIRFRAGVPERYEKMAMAHYSVFYFLGRAAKRVSAERAALEYPEDVLFLLDSVGDNFVEFLDALNELGGDCGLRVFDAPTAQFPKGFEPFQEISDYRDILLHNAVIGRGIDVEKTYIPKWNVERSASPLERVKTSWRLAQRLSSYDLVSTADLLNRLINEACATLEQYWRQAIAAVATPSFERKMVSITSLASYFPLKVQALPADFVPSASGSFSGLGSNTTFFVAPARSDAVGYETFDPRFKNRE